MSALKDIMSPKSVAIVGASDDKGRIGGKPLSYMLDLSLIHIPSPRDLTASRMPSSA